MASAYKVEHFLDAQEFLYPEVLIELKNGKKRSHWMWFIFPQLLGLGTSSKSVRFGIRDLAHAKTYLDHPTLGKRLVECALLLKEHTSLSARQIFGVPDDMKLHSSLTLFSLVDETSPLFQDLLKQFFSGQLDENTLEMLEKS